jgi:hypothetical protein
MRKLARLGLCAALLSTAWAGPVDFGRQELDRALVERKLSPKFFRVVTEVIDDAADSFRILPGQVSGGDIRGLMYGLIEAAEQVRASGRLLAAKGSPAIRIRGVRLVLQPADLQKDWYNSRAMWQEFCGTLARSRFNRLNVVFAQQRIETLAAEPNLEMLRFISQTAADYAIDFTIGLQTEALDDDSGALKRVLAACPTIRSVQAALYRDWLVRTVREAGRRITLELREQDLTPDRLEAEIPLRVTRDYRGDPATAAEPGPNDVVCIVDSGQTDPRKTVLAISQSGCAGFEIDAPQPPNDEANRLFFKMWGRLGYDPKTPDAIWSKEVKGR